MASSWQHSQKLSSISILILLILRAAIARLNRYLGEKLWNFAIGSLVKLAASTDYPANPNGNMLAEPELLLSYHFGETITTDLGDSPNGDAPSEHIVSDQRQLAVFVAKCIWAYMTCMEMSGNCAPIIGMKVMSTDQRERLVNR